MTWILETARFQLRELTQDDAAFIVELVNQRSFIDNIGDKGVRNLDDAKVHIDEKYTHMYQQLGYGLYGIADKTSGSLLGVCGLVKRNELDSPDLGYALLDECAGKGVCIEAAKAIVQYAFTKLALPYLYGVIDPNNQRSANVLKKLGFEEKGYIQLHGIAKNSLLFQLTAQR